MPLHILYALLPESSSDASWQRELASLPISFLHEAKRFVRPEDRMAHLLGRILLAKALEQMGFSRALLASLQRNSHNRPFVPAPVDFSISHSGSLVVCAITAEGRVGIDIEAIKPIDFTDFSKVFLSLEWDIITADPSPLEMFFRFWTKRESVLKATGSGLSGTLEYVERSFNRARSGDTLWHIQDIPSWQGYACSVATDYLCGSVKLIHLEI